MRIILFFQHNQIIIEMIKSVLRNRMLDRESLTEILNLLLALINTINCCKYREILLLVLLSWLFPFWSCENRTNVCAWVFAYYSIKHVHNWPMCVLLYLSSKYKADNIVAILRWIKWNNVIELLIVVVSTSHWFQKIVMSDLNFLWAVD